MQRYIIGLALAMALPPSAAAQDQSGAQQAETAQVVSLPTVWPGGAKAAIALTYDDSLESQLDNALPGLDDYGFKGTFYLTINRDGFPNRLEDWRAAANSGHEMGSHTLMHPCRSSLPDRDWVRPEADLDTYTPARFAAETVSTNIALGLLDGQDERTFAYPCGDYTAGGESFVAAIAPHVSAARGVRDAAISMAVGSVDLLRVPTLGAEHGGAAELIAYVDEVIDRGALGTLTFHGIGGDYLSIPIDAHDALLAHLDARRDEIYVDTLQNIVAYVSAELER